MIKMPYDLLMRVSALKIYYYRKIFILFALLLSLSELGCFDCPPLNLSIPKLELRANEEIRLHKTLEGIFLGSLSTDLQEGEKCQGFWYVNGILYGNDRLGRIDRCGVYQAPSTILKDQEIRISVSPYLLGIDTNESKLCKDECIACLDCCPIAEGRFNILGN